MSFLSYLAVTIFKKLRNSPVIINSEEASEPPADTIQQPFESDQIFRGSGDEVS